MKILHLTKFFPPARGGVENFVRDLSLAQVAQGNQVRVLAHAHSKAADIKTCNFHGIHLTRVPVLVNLAYAPLAPKYPGALKNLLKEFCPDIIHVHMPNLSPFWLLALKKAKARIVIHWHADVLSSCFDLKLRLLYPFYSIPEKLMLRRADSIIATSRSYLDSSKALQNFKSKTCVIPLGIDPTRLDASSDPKLHHENTIPVILGVGRFAYYKGFEYLIKAMTLLPEARLVLVGSGPCLADLKTLAAKIGVLKRVQFTGSLSSAVLGQYFSRCSLFCLPSIERTEAFGVVLLEAMLYAKPLISTEVPGSGMSEVNIAGKTGLTVPPQNFKLLARAIKTIISNPQKAQNMGISGRKRVLNCFHIRDIAAQISAHYLKEPGKK